MRLRPGVVRSGSMQRLLDETPDEPTTTLRQRVVIVGIAVFATCLIGLVAFLLGSWAYRARLLTSHEGRIERLVAKKPTLDLVTRALEADQSPLLAAPGSTPELERAVATWGAERAGDIRAKASRAARTRVFRSGDVVYFLFFDEGGVLTDFACVLQ
jgi:hypothetical protein